MGPLCLWQCFCYRTSRSGVARCSHMLKSGWPWSSQFLSSSSSTLSSSSKISSYNAKFCYFPQENWTTGRKMDETWLKQLSAYSYQNWTSLNVKINILTSSLIFAGSRHGQKPSIHGWSSSCLLPSSHWSEVKIIILIIITNKKEKKKTAFMVGALLACYLPLIGIKSKK